MSNKLLSFKFKIKKILKADRVIYNRQERLLRLFHCSYHNFIQAIKLQYCSFRSFANNGCNLIDTYFCSFLKKPLITLKRFSGRYHHMKPIISLCTILYKRKDIYPRLFFTG